MEKAGLTDRRSDIMRTFVVFAAAVLFGCTSTTFAHASSLEARCSAALKGLAPELDPAPGEHTRHVAAAEHAFNLCRARSISPELRALSADRWAAVLEQPKEQKRAESIYRQVLAEVKEDSGADSPALLALLDGLTHVLYVRSGGHPTEEMFTLAGDRLRITEKRYGKESEETSEAILNIGRYHEIAGSPGVAETYYREGIATAATACPSPKCWALSLAYRRLGELIQSEPARHGEAEELLKRSEEAAPPE